MRLGHRTTDNTAPGAPALTRCWGAPGGRAGALAPTPPGPLSPATTVAKPGKERGLQDLPVQPLKPGHPPRRRSSLRASSASSRSPPADSRPGPSSPRASMGPVTWRRGSPAPNSPGARGGHGFRGPRPVSELFPALLGAAPAGRPGARSLRPHEGGAAGGRGRGAGRGQGVAETRRGRPPALRAFAGGLGVPRRHPSAGPGEGGDSQGRSPARAVRGRLPGPRTFPPRASGRGLRPGLGRARVRAGWGSQEDGPGGSRVPPPLESRG